MDEVRTTLTAGMEITPSVRLVRPLGAGGMGAVWLADHRGLSTRVVVKFMRDDLDATARARFKREAEAAAQVKSPHVVQTFDCGVTSGGLPFIVMEHLEGHDLAREIAEHGPLEPARVVEILVQVSKALTKAHAANLLHRDIKPDNIFLCAQEDGDELFVKLLDFGIAKTRLGDAAASLMDGATKTGQVIGTPYYMSPEQMTAQKEIDHRSDLWSLGVVAFEALTGKRPFDGPSFGALAVRIATGETPLLSAIDPSLPLGADAWFAKACARDPEHRFGSARELADAFRFAFGASTSQPPLISRGIQTSTATKDESTFRPSFFLASTAPGSVSNIQAGEGSGPLPAEGAVRRRRALARALVLLGALLIVALGLWFGIGLNHKPSTARSSSVSRGTAPLRSLSAASRVTEEAVPAASETPLDMVGTTSDAAARVEDAGVHAPSLQTPTTRASTRTRGVAPKPADSAGAPQPSSTSHRARNDDPLF